MEPFRYHVYACQQQKPEGAPSCPARGSLQMIDALRKEIAQRGLMDVVQLTTCGSLGLCERGPNLVVYPEGIWYSGVRPDDVPEIVESHFKNGVPVDRLLNKDQTALGVEIRTNRDKMLAAMRAREASGALPDDVDQAIRGYQESRAILTGIELDVFSAAGDGASAADVASKCGTSARGMEILLDALVAIGLLVKVDGTYRTTPVSKRFFAEGGENDARAAMMHQSHLWTRWALLTESVRTGTAAAHRETGDRGDEWTRAFISAMHRNASERAPMVVRAVAATGGGGARKMLDIGGGSGAYSIAFAKANEALHVELIDLESVLPLAKSYIEAAGVSSRVTLRAGDLRTSALGGGYDLILVSAICHMLGHDENLDLVRRCHAALAPGGRLVIQDFILESGRTAPKHAALFSLNMLVGTADGRSYTEDEYRKWMMDAGFKSADRFRLPGPAHLMIGVRG